MHTCEVYTSVTLSIIIFFGAGTEGTHELKRHLFLQKVVKGHAYVYIRHPKHLQERRHMGKFCVMLSKHGLYTGTPYCVSKVEASLSYHNVLHVPYNAKRMHLLK